MKLLRCPVGFIGTKVGHHNVHIDKVHPEQRGYALVDDHVAEKLLNRRGYEVVDEAEYPRSLTDLYHNTKKNLSDKGIFTQNVDSTVETTTVVKTSKAITHATVPEGTKCWLCRTHSWLTAQLRKWRKA